MTEVIQHKNIAPALAAAQMQMGRALKNSKNPHFKSTYADLASVIDACREALAANRIAFIQQVIENNVKTVFLHSSGETLECLIPIIVQKNDMQGLGSAITYARRYGLMALAGIAPEDDDENAAVAAKPRYISAEQASEITELAKSADLDLAVICTGYKISSIKFLEDRHLPKVRQRLTELAQKAQEIDGISSKEVAQGEQSEPAMKLDLDAKVNETIEFYKNCTESAFEKFEPKLQELLNSAELTSDQYNDLYYANFNRKMELGL